MKIFRNVFYFIVSILKFVGRILFHGSPITYLILYLSLILIFTFVFCSIRDGFYHSTIQYEPFFHNEKEQIRDGLKNSLVEKLKIKNPDGIITYKKYELHENSLRTRAWKLEGDSASFVLYTHLSPSRIYWGVRVSFNTDPVQYSHKPTQPGEELVWIPEVLVTLEQLGSIRSEDYAPPIPVTEVFDTYFSPIDKKNHMLLPISPQLFERILAFARAVEGRPDSIPGNIWRMLYLSAVTITTLGFGDIVPLTTYARLCIATEAVLGIVVIGLFLNSLRNGFYRKNQKR